MPENTAITSYPGDRFRFRVAVRGGGANAPSRSYALFGRLCNPTCSVLWQRVVNTPGTLGISYIDDQINSFGTNTTNQLTLSGFSFVSGYFIDAEGAVPSVPIGLTQQVEWEYALQVDRSVVAAGDTMELKIRHDDGTDLDNVLVGQVSIGAGRGRATGDMGGAR